MVWNGIKLKGGDRVTIVNRFGQESTGKVNGLLVFPDHVVLNMGGKYGNPAVANNDNIVKVKVSK